MSFQSVMGGGKFLSGSIAVLAVSMFAVAPARAVLTLTISEPTDPSLAPVVEMDNANTGSLSYFGSYGDFEANFIVGLSDKESGGVGQAATLDLTSLNVVNLSNSGTKTLMITVTDDGYSFPSAGGSSVLLQTSTSGTMTNSNLGDGITYDSSVTADPISEANAQNSPTTGVQTFTAAGSIGATPFLLSPTPQLFTQPASYTISDTTTISMSAAGESVTLSGNTTVSAVPEPATIGLGVCGAALLLRRRVRRGA